MKTKSKVTSIRVDSEVYAEFKEVVAKEGKQVSAVMNEMMQKHIEQHKTIHYISWQNQNRIKVGFDKIKDQIDWSKVSRHAFVSVSAIHLFNDRSNIDDVIARAVIGTGFVKPVPCILETGDAGRIDLFVIEPKKQE